MCQKKKDSSRKIQPARLIPVILLLITVVTAGRSGSDPLDVEGDFGEHVIALARANAITCFKSLNETYFDLKPETTLKIYITSTPDQARQLIEYHGHAIEAGEGFYVRSVPAVYVGIGSDPALISFKPVYKSIAEHLVEQQFSDAPLWFRVGLASSLGDEAVLNAGKMYRGGPCTLGSSVLLSEIEANVRLKINRLFVQTDKGFNAWETGPHFARVFFNWLDSKGMLADYVKNVHRKGYALEVLDETTDMPIGKMNMELKRFIESDCRAAAKLFEASEADDFTMREEALKAAIEMKPNYAQARLALGRLYYDNGQHQLCRNYVKPIINQVESVLLLEATRLIAGSYFNERNWNAALEYYDRAWEISEHCFYRYQTAYRIACCHHYLKHYETAVSWYEKFLNFNSQSDINLNAVDYAERYIENIGT